MYILLFPFIGGEIGCPYAKRPHLFLKDTSFVVDTSFYRWVYDEMKRQNSIVLLELSLTDHVLSVVWSDAVIRKTREDADQKKNPRIITEEFDAWYEKGVMDAAFLIEIANPFLYMVPFPVQPILLKTGSKSSPLLKKA